MENNETLQNEVVTQAENNSDAVKSGEAKETVASPTGEAKKQTSEDELFGGLDRALEKRLPKIIRSMLKDNGVEDESELKELCDKYKARGESAKSKVTTENKDLVEENKRLKKEILTGRLNTKATEIASKLGVSAVNIPYVMKLSDLSGAVLENGEISDEKIEESLNQVLSDIPVLKTVEQNKSKGFTNIGTGEDTHESDTREDRIRRIMGVSKK